MYWFWEPLSVLIHPALSTGCFVHYRWSRCMMNCILGLLFFGRAMSCAIEGSCSSCLKPWLTIQPRQIPGAMYSDHGLQTGTRARKSTFGNHWATFCINSARHHGYPTLRFDVQRICPAERDTIEAASHSNSEMTHGASVPQNTKAMCRLCHAALWVVFTGWETLRIRRSYGPGRSST